MDETVDNFIYSIPKAEYYNMKGSSKVWKVIYSANESMMVEKQIDIMFPKLTHELSDGDCIALCKKCKINKEIQNIMFKKYALPYYEIKDGVKRVMNFDLL